MRIWTGTALTLALIVLGALLAGTLFSATVAAIALLAGLLGLVGYHAACLQRLANWSEGDDEPAIPPVRGVWGPVFQRLARRARAADEERLRLADVLDRFRDASHAMPDGIIYLSERDTIEWLNQRAEEHFGLDHLHDVGVALAGLVRSPDLARHLETGESGEPLVIPSPRRPALKLQIELIPFGNGQKMLISRDISQLEKLETMRRDFIANVSHELRTPLTVVSGFVETVMDGLDDLEREDVRRFLQMALEQSTRMQRLIEDLLALSALETGAPAPTEERVDVHALVRKVAEEATLLSAGRHSVELDLDARDEGDLILGSEKELHSAFANLASNAVRYTPSGGRIRIVWKRSASGAEFAVEDNGIGIDPAHIGRLTERFFRVDRGRSRETGGTGLGLAIVKHIASRHQAVLSIESEPGRGSRFSIVFPGSRLRRSRTPPRS